MARISLFIELFLVYGARMVEQEQTEENEMFANTRPLPNCKKQCIVKTTELLAEGTGKE